MSNDQPKEKTINEFKLVDENGIMSLVKDGFYCFCPFQQPVPRIEKIQTKQNSMTMEKSKCQSNCPHFTLKPDPNDTTKNKVEITCGRGVVHPISIIETLDNNTSANSVIKLHKA